MGIYGVLTRRNNGEYDLPLVEEFSRPVPVVEKTARGKVNHSAVIWTRWTNQQLAKHGFCRIEDQTVIPEGKRHAGGSPLREDLVEGLLTRIYAVEDTPITRPKAELRARVNVKRAEVIAGGITVTVDGEDYGLETDPESRELITGVTASMGAGVPFPLDATGTPAQAGTHISWRMADNRDVLMDKATFLTAVAGPLMQHVNAAHLASRAHKTAIDALSTWQEVANYDLEAGW